MPTAPDLPAVEAAIIAETNAFRHELDLTKVKPNARLMAAARAYAKSLAAHDGELKHNIDGANPWERAAAYGYRPCSLAQNLATIDDRKGSYAQRTLKAWKNTPSLRRHLLLPDITEVGVGVALGGPNGAHYFAVELLGRPYSLSYSFKIANRSGVAVTYAFGGKTYVAKPHKLHTHTACDAGTITFSANRKGNASMHYEARSGAIYTLRSDAGGRLKVKVSGKAPPN
jgi:hypothetical protein